MAANKIETMKVPSVSFPENFCSGVPAELYHVNGHGPKDTYNQTHKIIYANCVEYVFF